MPETLAVTENQEPQLCCHDVTKRCPFAEEADWLRLPYELWLSVLVEYGLCSTDLVSLDYACRWFSNCWGGMQHVRVIQFCAKIFVLLHMRSINFIFAHRFRDGGGGSTHHKEVQKEGTRRAGQ